MNDPSQPAPPPPAEGGAHLAALEAKIQEIRLENESLFRRLMADEERFRSLARAVWRVQEEERRRLAGELHDGLGQTLTALKIRLELLAGRLAAADPSFAGEVERAVEVAQAALHETRRLSQLLRPRVLDDLGLEPALRWLARTLGEWTDFEVELQVVGLDGPRLASEVESLVFRVVQESLTNALKHSGAGSASVRLERPAEGDRLRLEVRDEGRGFDPAQLASADGGGSGIAGLRDRLAAFGGRLSVRSQPGRGTFLEAMVPLAPMGAEAP